MCKMWSAAAVKAVEISVISSMFKAFHNVYKNYAANVKFYKIATLFKATERI